MNSFDYYIDLYGWGGWKTSEGGAKAPLVMMLRDEITSPGSTDLSKLDRFALERTANLLTGSSSDERALMEFSEFTSLRFDNSNVPVLSDNGDLNQLLIEMDEAYKSYASILYVHGEEENPFTLHTDYLLNSGEVVKDVFVRTDLDLLEDYYQGAINLVNLGYNILEFSPVITSEAIFTNMLSMVIANGIATASEVQAAFGTYAPEVTAAAVAAETKLPVLQALSDPLAESMFKAYIAYFGRPADPAGMQFWIDKINQSGTSITDMVGNFSRSDEYADLYGTVNSSAVINSLYQHLFNREAATVESAFWAKHLDDGNFTLSNIAFTIINSAQLSDATIIEEKVSAARTFTSALDTQREVELYSNNTSALNARKWLSTISDDATENTVSISIVGQVINGLQSGVDGILAAYGLEAGHY